MRRAKPRGVIWWHGKVAARRGALQNGAALRETAANQARQTRARRAGTVKARRQRQQRRQAVRGNAYVSVQTGKVQNHVFCCGTWRETNRKRRQLGGGMVARRQPQGVLRETERALRNKPPNARARVRVNLKGTALAAA